MMGSAETISTPGTASLSMDSSWRKRPWGMPSALGSFREKFTATLCGFRTPRYSMNGALKSWTNVVTSLKRPESSKTC